jgi:alkaline phosphatase isozyme conversion protein
MTRRLAVALILALLALGAPACGMRADPGLPSQDAADSDPGAIAYATMEQFSTTVGPRPSDGWGAIRAREFVLHAFQQYGYEPTYQEFVAGPGDERVQSANLVALKPGESGETLVVGAHYDTVVGSAGASDNASGVAVLIELAARLAEKDTPYSIAFVAFGAEEVGLYGSLHYVKAMDDTTRGAVMGMINLDGVAGGETLYSYGVEGEDSWLQKDILGVAEDLGVDLDTDVILQVTPPVSRGVGYDIAGDHIPFAGYDIPVAGFITGDDHLMPARASFWPMNTRADSMATMEKRHPGLAQRQLRDVVRVLDVVLTSELATES